MKNEHQLLINNSTDLTDLFNKHSVDSEHSFDFILDTENNYQGVCI